MIAIFADSKEIKLKRLEFSDGAITFLLEDLPEEEPNSINIRVDPITPVALIREELELVMSCLEEVYDCPLCNVDLYIPYFPYARADRVFERGNPSPLRGLLLWLQGWNLFRQIYTCDLHNERVLGDFFIKEDIKIKPQLECFKQSLPYNFNTEYDVVVAPDKGAMNKARTISEYLKVDIEYAGKKRDVQTGRIVGTELPKGVDFTNKTILIPDDICDGGMTFIKLAEALKQAGAKKVDLYVTHLIAAKGLKFFENSIDKIYYYHVVSNYINNEDVLKFNER